jgi:hypothetical protein
MLDDGLKVGRRLRLGDGKKLRSRSGLIELFLYRLAVTLRIGNVEEWKHTLTLDQLHRWIAYYRVEPFGGDWLRTAKATMFTVAALGAKPDQRFMEMFLPSYNPDREMTPDEIEAELAKLQGP